jgi:predicted RNA binding protein YcfA (HicA-like mRNA interferase family)
MSIYKINADDFMKRRDSVRDGLQAKKVSRAKSLFDSGLSYFLVYRGETLVKTGQLHPFVIFKSKLYLTNSLQVCINTHMESRKIIKILEKDGWYKADQSGSHIQFRHPTKKGRVTVPHPKKDLPIGTLKSIERQAGIKFK